MATINTKFSIGDIVYCLDKRGTLRERKVMGVRTQILSSGKQKTLYSFLKDHTFTQDYLRLEPPIYTEDNFFWLAEPNIYESIPELKKNLR